ncbi:MAG: YggT family protein [Candidatus Poribacteria bacterium]|nr:YggT family protein [Candidatus Poribacteria bacterium]
MALLAWILGQLIEIYVFIVIGNSILSWFVYGTQNSTVRQIYWWTSRIVDPALTPIRRALGPRTRNLGIDISPFILIFLLMILQGMF